LKYNYPVLVCKFCLPKVVQSNQKMTSRSSLGPYAKGEFLTLDDYYFLHTFDTIYFNICYFWLSVTLGEGGEQKRLFGAVEGYGPSPGGGEMKECNDDGSGGAAQMRQQEEVALVRRRREAAERERNLENVERERALCVERRKINGSRIHELRRGEMVAAVVDSPSSGSDCGSVIVDMQFV
jgi:hypothetical protein